MKKARAENEIELPKAARFEKARGENLFFTRAFSFFTRAFLRQQKTRVKNHFLPELFSDFKKTRAGFGFSTRAFQKARVENLNFKKTRAEK